MCEELAVINFNTLLLLHLLLLTIQNTIQKTRKTLGTKSEHIVFSFILIFLHLRKCYYEVRSDGVPVLCTV
jgi:hypothetical protein